MKKIAYILSASLLVGIALSFLFFKPDPDVYFGATSYKINPFTGELDRVDTSTGTSTTTLTSTQVAYGSSDNTVTSSPNFTFTSSTNVLSVTSVSSTYATTTDLSVPASQPYVVSTLTSSTIMAQSYSTFVSGNYAYMVSLVGDSLTVIDVSNPTSPMIRGVFTSSTDLNGSRNVYVAGKYAYVANQDDDSLAIIDISNPSNPTFTGKVKNATDMDRTYFVNVAGQYAYVINNADNSLRIIDVSSSTAPVIVGGIKDNTNLAGAYGMNVNGRYAYVAAANDNSLRIIDISNPASPTIVGGVKDASLLSAVRAVAVSGRYAYATAFTGDTFAVIDVSNPASPSIVGSITDATNLNGARSVTIQGSYAYVGAANNNSIAVIDISSSTAPRIVYNLQDATNLNIPHGVFVAGNYLYAAMNTSSNPNFTIVGLNGLTSATGDIGSLKVSNINVQDDAVFNRNVVIQSGLNVGDRGILTSGALNGNGLVIHGMTTTTNLQVNSGLFVDGQTRLATSLTGLAYLTSGVVSATSSISSLSLSGFSNGSVIFATSSGLLSQDNSGLYFDSVNNRLGVNTSTVGSTLVVAGNSELRGTLQLFRDGTSAAGWNNNVLSTWIFGGFRPMLGFNGTTGKIGYIASGGTQGHEFITAGRSVLINTRSEGGTTEFTTGGSITSYTNAALDIVGTWNNSTTRFWAIRSNFTDTGSNATTSLIDLMVGNVTKFNVQKDGWVAIATSTPIAALTLNASTTAAGGLAFGSDVNLYRSATDTLRTDDTFNVGGALNITGLSTLAGLTFTNATGTLISVTERTFDGTPNTDHTGVGNITETFNSGATTTIMDVLFLSSGGTWMSANASTSTSSTSMLSIDLQGGTTGNPVKVALPNTFVRDDSWNWTPGQTLYLSTSNGAVTSTAPSGTDQVVRILGHAITADVIYWNPSNNYLVLE